MPGFMGWVVSWGDGPAAKSYPSPTLPFAARKGGQKRLPAICPTCTNGPLPLPKARGGLGRGSFCFCLAVEQPKPQCAGANPPANDASTEPACSCVGAALAKAC